MVESAGVWRIGAPIPHDSLYKMIDFLVPHQKTHHKEDAARSGGHTLAKNDTKEKFAMATVATRKKRRKAKKNRNSKQKEKFK